MTSRPRERSIERYFVRKVKEAGGEVRKVKWIGRAHAPDRLVLWPGKDSIHWSGYHPLVEVKRPGEKPRPGQKREHARLAAAGFQVFTLSTTTEVDNFVFRYACRR